MNFQNKGDVTVHIDYLSSDIVMQSCTCDFLYIDRRASFNKSVRLFEWCVPCRWTQLKHNGSGISVPYDAHGPGSLFS